MKKNIMVSCILLVFSITISAKISIIHNIEGNTINNGQRVNFKAMAFEDGKVLKIGSKEQLLKAYSTATMIDGHGKSMLPGLHDAHGHIFGLAKLKNEIDLMSVSSLEESLQIIQKFIDEHPNNSWILGRGWNQALWKGKKFPTYKDLDTLKTNKPIWLRRVDGHAGWANSKAMEIAKTNQYLKDLPGGEIIVDDKGIQTGIFVDNAMELVSEHIGVEKDVNNTELIHEALEYLASLGLTSIDDAGIDWLEYDIYKSLTSENKLPIRINVMLGSWSKVFDKMLSYGPYKDNFLQIHMIKYVSDGALGSRGAAMLAPYHDRPDAMGLFVQPKEFIQEAVFANAEKGWQAGIHAIGDKANRISIEIFSDPRAKTSEIRHRIEHAQIIDFDDLSRVKAHNIIASMQPTHATSDKNMAEDRIGRKRLRGAYAWQTLLKKGVVIASGSDFPVELANPFFGLHAAVTRQDRDNQPPKGWIPVENMTVEQALESFTISAAYANRRENELGSLEPGKWADFILVDQDIFTIEKSDIWKTQVHQTWVAGKKIFDNTLEK